MVSAGSLELHRRTQRVELDGHELKVTAKEFVLLWLFVQNRGLVLHSRRDREGGVVWLGEKPHPSTPMEAACDGSLPRGQSRPSLRLGYRFDL